MGCKHTENNSDGPETMTVWYVKRPSLELLFSITNFLMSKIIIILCPLPMEAWPQCHSSLQCPLFLQCTQPRSGQSICCPSLPFLNSCFLHPLFFLIWFSILYYVDYLDMTKIFQLCGSTSFHYYFFLFQLI